MNKNVLIIIGTSAASLVVGAFAGYQYAVHKLEGKYEELAAEEAREIRKHYAERIVPKQQFATPEEAAAALIPQGMPNPTTTPDEETLVRVIDGLRYGNVFGSKEPPPANFDEVVESRDRSAPYIISVAEFGTNDVDHNQITVTFFEGDRVVMEALTEQVIDTAEKHIGLGNIRFGEWSGDANIVYIRNEELGVDFEVLRSSGKYSEEVAGFKE